MSIKYIGAFIKGGCTITGADKGEKKLREIFDFSDVLYEVPQPETDDKKLLNLNTTADFCFRLNQILNKYPSDFKVTVGGDHALSIGSIPSSYQEDMALVWIDAHGDSNTDQTTISGRIHGMPVSVLQGLGSEKLTSICDGKYLKPENIVFYGIRSLDPLEEELIQQRKIKFITTEEIKENRKKQIKQLISYIKDKPVYISFDLDSIDPKESAGVNTPVPQGIHTEDVCDLIEELFKQCKVVGMDIVEYNPLNDDGNTYPIVLRVKNIIEKYQ